MNVFVQSLAELCRTNLLEEKWIVAPSLRTGHQWLDSVARAGQPVVNARITTIKGLALELAAATMAEKGVSLANSQEAAILIDAMLNRPTAGGAGYLSSLQPSPGLSQTIFAALDAMRLAGMDAQDLRPDAFEVDGKAQDLARLLGEYLQRLDTLRLVDYAAVLSWAISRLKQASNSDSPLPHAGEKPSPTNSPLPPAGEGKGVRAGKAAESPSQDPFPAVMLSEAKHLNSPAAKEILRFAQDDRSGRAGSAVGSDSHAPALAPDTIVLLPDDIDLTALERSLVDAIPTDKRRTVAVDQPLALPQIPRSVRDDTMFGEDGWDALLLRWLPSPADAPEPKHDGSAEIFRAVGEVNEVREVLRRVVAMQRPLDEVEVLHTDTDTYVPLFYELASRLQPEADGPDEELPITFLEGVPVRYSRPGRALVAWLAWIREGYPQASLVRMLQDGLIDVPGRDRGEFSFSGLAALLRSVGIGMGRQRYSAKLAEQIAGCREQWKGLDEAGTSPHALTLSRERERGGDVDGPRRSSIDRRLQGLTLLDGLVQALLALSPRSDAPAGEILDAAARFLQQSARSVSELDNYARRALVEEVQRMRRWLDQAGAPQEAGSGTPGEPRASARGSHDPRVNASGSPAVRQLLSHDFWDWLLALAGQVRVGGSGPRPGRLHLAHVQSGGHSGRPVTFLVGLDDSRFPGAGLQDPLLLDHERAKLSADLTTAAGQMKDRLDDFARLLARLRGRVTLSFSCHNLAEDREMFPSPAVLSAYRILSGKRDGDQSDLMEWLPPPASFAPERADGCLDGSEWWMWRLCGPEPVERVGELVAEHFPHLERGRRAAAERSGERFTAFDGLVPEAGRESDPASSGGRVLSASGLETIGRCPLAYFFRYVLGIERPEELAIDANVWLSPPDFGSLLHEVFRRFLSRLRGGGLLPDLARDLGTLLAVLDEEAARWRDQKPPPSESVYRAQYRQLQEAARVFLAGEEELCRRCRPEYLEAALGMRSLDQPTPLDDPRPIAIELPDGRTFLARGRIDRVDRVGPESSHEYAVWDYKTGGTWKFRDAASYATGRVVQPALYQAMVQAALRRKIDPQAVVTQFGYTFPTAQGQGDRVYRSQKELAEGMVVLQRLCGIVDAGAFLATNKPDDCAYCDYAPICRNIEATTARSEIKLKSPENKLLQPMRELRSDA